MNVLQAKLFSEIERINERIVTIRHDLHAHPELSGHEEHTKYLVKGILEAEGIVVQDFDDNFGLIAEIVTRPAA